jgi:hypothetical protein
VHVDDELHRREMTSRVSQSPKATATSDVRISGLLFPAVGLSFFLTAATYVCPENHLRCIFTRVFKPSCSQAVPWPMLQSFRDRLMAPATPSRHLHLTPTGHTRSGQILGLNILVHNWSARSGRTSMASGGIKMLPALTQSIIHHSDRLWSGRFWSHPVSKAAYQVSDID